VAVREHALPLFRAARAQGFSASDAEDLVQDVFVTLLRGADRFENAGAWAGRIVRRNRSKESTNPVSISKVVGFGRPRISNGCCSPNKLVRR
jgi:hypothetical protein